MFLFSMHLSLYLFILLCFALLCFALLCFALHCIALLCFALLCFALHCIALHCFALHCFALLRCWDWLRTIERRFREAVPNGSERTLYCIVPHGIPLDRINSVKDLNAECCSHPQEHQVMRRIQEWERQRACIPLPFPWAWDRFRWVGGGAGSAGEAELWLEEES